VKFVDVNIDSGLVHPRSQKGGQKEYSSSDKKLVTNITDVRDRIAVRSSRRLVSTRWIQKCHRCVTRLALAGVLIHRRASHGPVIRQTERDKASRDEQWW